MAFLKGERIDGCVNVNDDVRFNGNVLGLNGGLPHRSEVYYVDGAYGSDNNTGKTFDGAFKTLAHAFSVMRDRINWSATPWANYDFLYVAPGVYAENITALPHGCSVVGLGWDNRDAQCGVKIKPASGSPISVGGFVNGAFYNIGFESVDTNEAFYSGELNNCYFYRCLFTGSAEDTSCTEAILMNDVTRTIFKECHFCNAGYGVRFEYADSGDKIAYVRLEDCFVTGVDTVGIYTSASLAKAHNLVLRCHVGGGGQTLATGIDDNSHAFEVDWTCFEATSPVGTGTPMGVNGSYGNGGLLT